MQNRRHVLKTLLGLGILGVVSPRRLKAQAPTPTKPIDLNDPVAKALGYVNDASKADSTKYPQLKTPEGKAQRCSNCLQFTATSGGLGKCVLLPSGLVNANGWCSGWVKKAG